MSPRAAKSAPAEPRRASREVELSLVVVAPDPEDVLRRIARLRKVEDYSLRPRGSERIVDRYYDTPERTLRERGVALRLREVNGTTLIGVKGRRRSASTRTEDRFERERRLSRNAVEEVRRRLRLTAPGDERVPRGVDPDVLLASSLGVQLIQLRETRRLVRDVVDHGRRRPVLAELALDRVRFRLDAREVRHYEVEVEAKLRGRGTTAARAVAAELRDRYPGQLTEWPYGKLPTGMAIEALLASGRLEPRGVLTAADYQRISRYLERQS